MANNIDLTICALECPLGTFQCSGRLIFRKEYTVLFSPKRTTSRFASLTLRTTHRPIVSLCFSGRLIFRLRTESAFQAAPVFRMAYSAPTAHRAVSSETLMLQPLRGLRTAHRPPVSSPLAAAAALWLPCVRGAVRRRAGLRGCLRVRGKGKGRRPSPVSAPNRLFELLRCFARLIRQAETLELQPHSRPPSKHTVLFLPKHSCFRFASLTLRLRTETFFQKVPVFRMAYSAIPHHRPYGRWCFARLIRQAETLELQPHSRPPSKRTVLFLPKRSCSRFASLSLRTPHRPPVSSPLVAAAD